MGVFVETFVFPESSEAELREQLVPYVIPGRRIWRNKNTALIFIEDIFTSYDAARDYIYEHNGDDLPLFACRYHHPVQESPPEVLARLQQLGQTLEALSQQYQTMRDEVRDPQIIAERQAVFARLTQTRRERNALLATEHQRPPVRVETRWLVGGAYADD